MSIALDLFGQAFVGLAQGIDVGMREKEVRDEKRRAEEVAASERLRKGKLEERQMQVAEEQLKLAQTESQERVLGDSQERLRAKQRQGWEDQNKVWELGLRLQQANVSDAEFKALPPLEQSFIALTGTKPKDNPSGFEKYQRLNVSGYAAGRTADFSALSQSVAAGLARRSRSRTSGAMPLGGGVSGGGTAEADYKGDVAMDKAVTSLGGLWLKIGEAAETAATAGKTDLAKRYDSMFREIEHLMLDAKNAVQDDDAKRIQEEALRIESASRRFNEDVSTMADALLGVQRVKAGETTEAKSEIRGAAFAEGEGDGGKTEKQQPPSAEYPIPVSPSTRLQAEAIPVRDGDPDRTLAVNLARETRFEEMERNAGAAVQGARTKAEVIDKAKPFILEYLDSLDLSKTERKTRYDELLRRRVRMWESEQGPKRLSRGARELGSDIESTLRGLQ